LVSGHRHLARREAADRAPQDRAFQAEPKGEFQVVEGAPLDAEDLEAGAEDVKTDDDAEYEIITAPDDFEAVKSAIEKASIAILDSEVTMLPQNYARITGKEAEQMIKLMDALDDNDDVQKVYTNADIPDEVMNAL
nr:YebC/PmpR family DNA-binding transcriptional regulator [Desulfobacteraceae bacterium]